MRMGFGGNGHVVLPGVAARALPPSVSAVLPAYNEEAAIESVVRKVAEALSSAGVTTYEIIVVNDGSTDATAERAMSAVARGIPVRVISHEVNRGYGAALRTGFDAATCEATWLLDSDGQFDPAELQRLMPLYRDDRVVAGYRIHRQEGRIRDFNHLAFFTVVRFTIGGTVRDVDCAFKLFPSAVGRGLRCDGAMISTELLVRARRAGYGFAEVGVKHLPRQGGQATGANPRVIARAFRELLRLWGHPALLSGLAAPAEELTGRARELTVTPDQIAQTA